MTSLSPARRRSEEFASLIDGRGGNARAFSDQIDLVALLQSVPAPKANLDYVRDLRAGLMAAADTLLVPGAERLSLPSRETSPRRRERRIAVAATTLAILGGTTGISFASQSALPSDSLYPIKRILESARTSLSPNDQARADRIMGLAEGRLDEAQALALRDNAESRAAIPTALSDFVAQATQAANASLSQFADSGDTAHVIELRNFTADSLDVLAGLKSLVPAEYGDDFDAAVNALLSIDERTLSACPDCGGLLDVPSILLSGAPIDPAGSPSLGAAPSAAGTDAIEALLGQLPALGATLPTATTPSTSSSAPAKGTEAPSIPGSTSGPLGSALDPSGIGGLLPSDPLGSLLDPLLDPVLGPDGLL